MNPIDGFFLWLASPAAFEVPLSNGRLFGAIAASWLMGALTVIAATWRAR